MKNLAVITGASSGLGREFARQIAEKKNFDEIWIIARRKDRLDEVATEINSEMKKNLVKAIALDISTKDGIFELKNLLEREKNEVEKFTGNENSDFIDESTNIAGNKRAGNGDCCENAKDEFKIGLLINNAGFGTYGPFAETSVTREMEMIDLNCTSLTGICGIALPFLKKDSVIINTASLAAFLPLGNFAVYAASKAYVLSFTVALAAELKDRGIKVCALCPGSVSTEFANVASNGARKEVKGGHDPVKVVAHCLKKAFAGKKIALWYPKWKFTAFMSRFIGRYFGARYTYRYNPRPHNPD